MVERLAVVSCVGRCNLARCVAMAHYGIYTKSANSLEMVHVQGDLMKKIEIKHKIRHTC